MATKQAADDQVIVIPQIRRQTVVFHIIGQSPLILNRMSRKAWGELLAPRGRKTSADKQATLKHDPLTEFRDSANVFSSEEAPVLLAIMSSAFKGAMGTAALDLPGSVKKTQIGRLVYVENDLCPIYGIPKVFMAITRSADMAHTPDVRTRAIVPRWAARVEVTFVSPNLTQQAIANLLVAAGTTCGVGDWRPEKGKGAYGRFTVVNADDPEYIEITQQGRAAQIAAMDKPEAYDAETAEMLGWWNDEVLRRGFTKDGRVALMTTGVNGNG